MDINDANAPAAAPQSIVNNLFAFLGVAIIVAAAGMICFSCVTLYQIFMTPDDVPLVKTILGYINDTKPALSGKMNGQDVSIEMSQGFKSISMMLFTIMGLGGLVGAFSAMITAGVTIMKLAYGQPLYAGKPSRN